MNLNSHLKPWLYATFLYKPDMYIILISMEGRHISPYSIITHSISVKRGAAQVKKRKRSTHIRPLNTPQCKTVINVNNRLTPQGLGETQRTPVVPVVSTLRCKIPLVSTRLHHGPLILFSIVPPLLPPITGHWTLCPTTKLFQDGSSSHPVLHSSSGESSLCVHQSPGTLTSARTHTHTLPFAQTKYTLTDHQAKLLLHFHIVNSTHSSFSLLPLSDACEEIQHRLGLLQQMGGKKMSNHQSHFRKTVNHSLYMQWWTDSLFKGKLSTITMVLQRHDVHNTDKVKGNNVYLHHQI